MRPFSILVPLGVSLIVSTGCWFRLSSSTTTVTLAGVKFTVEDSGGASSSTTTNSSGTDGKTEESHQLRVGDLTIDLAEEVDGAMPMTVNGVPHGTLRRGDHVVIDTDRTITVNGQVRTGE